MEISCAVIPRIFLFQYACAFLMPMYVVYISFRFEDDGTCEGFSLSFWIKCKFDAQLLGGGMHILGSDVSVFGAIETYPEIIYIICREKHAVS